MTESWTIMESIILENRASFFSASKLDTDLATLVSHGLLHSFRSDSPWTLLSFANHNSPLFNLTHHITIVFLCRTKDMSSQIEIL
jgi:hypothetical protein